MTRLTCGFVGSLLVSRQPRFLSALLVSGVFIVAPVIDSLAAPAGDIVLIQRDDFYSNGTAKETIVALKHDLYQKTACQVIDRPAQVDSHIDGKSVAKHTIRIPAFPLGAHVSASDEWAGNAHEQVEWIRFERVII